MTNDDQPNYLCNDDDLNSLTDYFTAALAGEESKSRLQQTWEQEIGIIKATRTATKQTGPIPIGERRTCKYQEIVNYPGDEYVLCHSKTPCVFQTPCSVPPDIFCNKEIVSHDIAIRNAVLDELGVLHGGDAKRFNELLDHPEPLTSEARDLVMQAKEIAKKERTALDYSDHIRDLETIISLSKKLLHQFPDDFSLKMSMQQASQELKRLESLRVTTPVPGNRDYQCGDNCHGECSGEYDGKIHCPETEPKKKVGE